MYLNHIDITDICMNTSKILQISLSYHSKGVCYSQWYYSVESVSIGFQEGYMCRKIFRRKTVVVARVTASLHSFQWFSDECFYLMELRSLYESGKIKVLLKRTKNTYFLTPIDRNDYKSEWMTSFDNRKFICTSIFYPLTKIFVLQYFSFHNFPGSWLDFLNIRCYEY